MKLLLLSYRYLLAIMLGAGWYGLAVPYLVSAADDLMPIAGILSIPLVAAIILWLVVPPLKKLFTQLNKESK